jgi:hypothetical protein
MNDDDRPWDWTAARLELAALLDDISPDDALFIVRRLIQVENEAHVAPILAGLVRGTAARRKQMKGRTA